MIKYIAMGICYMIQGAQFSDNLEKWDGLEDGEGGFRREGTYVYLWQIHADVW